MHKNNCLFRPPYWPTVHPWTKRVNLCRDASCEPGMHCEYSRFMNTRWLAGCLAACWLANKIRPSEWKQQDSCATNQQWYSRHRIQGTRFVPQLTSNGNGLIDGMNPLSDDHEFTENAIIHSRCTEWPIHTNYIWDSGWYVSDKCQKQSWKHVENDPA